MKNLLIYISPTHSFDNPRSDLINDALVSVKIQIENSLELGWKRSEIMLITNFDFEYAGVKAQVLNDVDFFNRKPQASKINAIIKLFEDGTIKKNEVYWFHDLDAFQSCSIEELEVDLKSYDLALSDYGINSRWSTGVIYFKHSAQDLFYKIREIVYKKNIDEERALTFLTRNDQIIDKRVKRINKSYNYTPRNIKAMYPPAIKPIKVLHFHPLGRARPNNPLRGYNFFNGENDLHLKLIPDRLIKILKFHRVR